MAGLMDIGKWFSNGKNLSGVGSMLGAVGGLYGGYQQSKYAKKLLKMQEADFNRGIKREDEADASLKTAWKNSTYNKPLVKLG